MANLKDYYKTLNVPVNASAMDIKKAYRSLAMRYHPDRNEGDKYAEAFFKELQEAYGVLKNPHSRQAYTQKRFYNVAPSAKNNDITTPTPLHMLEEAKKILAYVKTLDVYRMDKEALYMHIAQLLSPATIHMLNDFDEQEINNQIIVALMSACRPLELDDVEKIADKLLGIRHRDENIAIQIKELVKTKKTEAFWNKYQLLVLLLITLVLCFFIYEAGK